MRRWLQNSKIKTQNSSLLFPRDTNAYPTQKIKLKPQRSVRRCLIILHFLSVYFQLIRGMKTNCECYGGQTTNLVCVHTVFYPPASSKWIPCVLNPSSNGSAACESLWAIQSQSKLSPCVPVPSPGQCVRAEDIAKLLMPKYMYLCGMSNIWTILEF